MMERTTLTAIAERTCCISWVVLVHSRQTLVQDFGDGAETPWHPHFFSPFSVSKAVLSQQKQINKLFPVLILGLLSVLTVYHGHCRSYIMHHTKSTAGDDFILAC